MPDKYKITCDLFTLDYKDDLQVLYAPKLGFVCAVNHDMINLLAQLDTLDIAALNHEQKAALDYLAQKGVLNGSKEITLSKSLPEKFTPAMVTLFPTNQCNLRCRYCYASAGDKPPEFMDFSCAKGSVDLVINNLGQLNRKTLNLGFHGGGEPLLPWDFIRRTVEYAKEQCEKKGLELSVFSATNGVLSEKKLEWIIKHFKNLNISFDGLPHVQDYHRPMPGKKGSFEFVNNTMKFLDDHDFQYGIRNTISSYNVEIMEESMDYIAENYKSRQVHFEPLFFCGRCKTSSSLMPDLKLFESSFRKCESKSREYNMFFTYSGSRLETLTDSFCGVSNDNFAVTCSGHITTCYEITSLDDPKSETFFLGRIDNKGNLFIDNNKREFLHSLTVNNLPFCQDCFARWHCAGDCPLKLGHTDYKGNRGHGRCELNRQLTRTRLISLLEGTYYNPLMNNFQPGKNPKEKQNE
ncbi:Radical SAM domain-containing protein [Desulfonema limicola]|uniref:Radical SAM domain-containing protein n=1 Tax=Desulfonema limicola TaxID=45656 RepID=A0A975GIU3_9BACT|nr:radical SAM protein [Desulfonema limicola]QTA82826.1 Radical SAM domain-containing protein [Desulfonema limicola]